MDWKDKLNSLRGSLEEPSSEAADTEVLKEEKKPSQKGSLMVVLDKKGRNGKVATIIEGFTIPQEEVEKIARELKNKLGTGGSVREGEILIQGDRKNHVMDYLKSKNFKVR